MPQFHTVSEVRHDVALEREATPICESCGLPMWLTLHKRRVDHRASHLTQRFECLQCGAVAFLEEDET
jgi:transcription elongation factor Elf1